MSVFPSSQATIDLQVLPTFPANVVATGAVDISKSGLTYTFGLNFQNVIEETNVSDLGKRELLAQDTDTGAFWRIKLANLPPSPHTHPVSQISDATPLGQALVTALDTATAQTTLNVPPNTRTISAGTGLTGGGDLSADRTLSLADMPQATVKGRAPGAGAGAPQDLTITQVLDALGTAQGSVIYRGASGWAALGAGAAGQVLTSGGAGADPSWKTATAASIDAGILAGFRNKIINGNFDIWQRGTSQSGLGYGSADRWSVNGIAPSGAILVSRQELDLGQTDVPGNPRYYIRIAGSSFSSTELNLGQAIEDVRTLAGRRATLTFWARASAPRQLRPLLVQEFGTGGSPSSPVNTFGDPVNLTTSWQKFSQVFDVPSIAGKVLGTHGNDALGVVVDIKRGEFGTDLGNDTIDLARVSLVEGDATAEDDPFSPRHIQQELALCQRYFERVLIPKDHVFTYGQAYDPTLVGFIVTPKVTMRAAPTFSSSNLYAVTATGQSMAITSIDTIRANPGFVNLNGITSGLTAGNASAITGGENGGEYSLSAEL